MSILPGVVWGNVDVDSSPKYIQPFVTFALEGANSGQITLLPLEDLREVSHAVLTSLGEVRVPSSEDAMFHLELSTQMPFCSELASNKPGIEGRLRSRQLPRIPGHSTLDEVTVFLKSHLLDIIPGFLMRISQGPEVGHTAWEQWLSEQQQEVQMCLFDHQSSFQHWHRALVERFRNAENMLFNSNSDKLQGCYRMFAEAQQIKIFLREDQLKILKDDVRSALQLLLGIINWYLGMSKQPIETGNPEDTYDHLVFPTPRDVNQDSWAIFYLEETSGILGLQHYPKAQEHRARALVREALCESSGAARGRFRKSKI